MGQTCSLISLGSSRIQHDVIMMEKPTRVKLHQYREVSLLVATLRNVDVYCVVRPDSSQAAIHAAMSCLAEIGEASFFSPWRVKRILRRLGRTWTEVTAGVGWTEDLAAAISMSRDLLEDLDLAGVSPLEVDRRDEYDDVIFAIMANIIVGDSTSIVSWVKTVYEIGSRADQDQALSSTLQAVENFLAATRGP